MSNALHVQLISPAGWAAPQAVERGVLRLRHAGCVVDGVETAARRHQRFAGTDAERTADIHRLVDAAVAPDIVMAVRGGSGCHRLLEHLDYDALRQRWEDRPPVLTGFSDITALSMALLAKAGWVTFSGPMLAHDFGCETPSAFTIGAFADMMSAPRSRVGWQATQDVAGIAVSGTVWGGNLAIICGLLGTPYLPRIEGGILFLEDVAEPPYRIDRLLGHLQLAGVLERQSAIVLGEFSGSGEDPYDAGYDLAAIVAHLRTVTAVPIVTGLPIGHGRDKLALPIGAHGSLRVDARGKATLDVDGYPYRPRANILRAIESGGRQDISTVAGVS